MDDEYDTLRVTTADGVRRVVLSRPESLNAIDATMLAELRHALADASSSDEVRVLVLTGAGRAFCSGVDVRGMRERSKDGRTPSESRQRARGRDMALARELAEFEKPLVGEVNGVCAGAGLAIALSCQFVYASTEATFSFTFVRRGLVPDYGLTHLLPRLVGLRRATDLCLRGATVDAEEAHNLGMITRVVPHGALRASVADLARQLASGPGVALQLANRLLRDGGTRPVESTLEAEFTAQAICLATDDARESLDAFLEKRPPQFTSR